jgi:thiol-disulfide isomerase/thioredoxin
VAQQFGGQVGFKVENYGDSELAKRFGVKRYPAIFVDDILVATPKDFGWYGKGEGEGTGRYAPLKSSESHERFRADLAKTLRLVLAGRTAAARAMVPSQDAAPIAELPDLDVADLDGKPLKRAQLDGRVVVVEFWATWCPPCRRTLAWLGELKKKNGSNLAIVTVAIESDAANVKQILDELKLPARSMLGTPELARSFGDISAVPTLFIFDRHGKTVSVLYGAPPTLHAEAEAAIAKAM